MSYIKGQELIWSKFREVAERHLESGSPPGGLEELHQGAELWAFNTDFSLEFPQPLMPYTVLVGGLLNKPPKPPEQVFSLETNIQQNVYLSHSLILPCSTLTRIFPSACFLHCPEPKTLLIPQELESWISSFGEAGFIVVTLGSMVSAVSVDPLLVELVAGFSMTPQGVLWR